MTGRPNLTLLAWRTVPRMPEAVTGVLFHAIGLIAWALHGKGVRQLERNLARVRPGLCGRALRRASRAGMVAYLRYFGEVFQAGRLTDSQIAARVRAVRRDRLDAAQQGGAVPVLALGHMGNWDLAGAWASREVGTVTTAAERLEPPELFEDFVAIRARLGIEIVPADAGQAFRPLLRAASSREQGIVPLLADRDLTRQGVEVTIFGHAARVAAGPAALAIQAGVPLVPLAMTSERLTGARRRAAGSRYGYALRVLPQVRRRPELDRAGEIQAMTQDWATALADAIAMHPQDWHMLQKVFVEDLDQAKDAAVRS
jgi:KDO2-lipid IV(A) lauroyltransferase